MRSGVPRPVFVIDECLSPLEFRPFLEVRGCAVLTVGDAFPSGSPDPSVLAVAEAEAEAAIVLSCDAHWKTLLTQVRGHQGRVRQAGRVLLDCDHDKNLARLPQLFDDVEREINDAYVAGRRVMIRITGGSIRIDK